MRIKLIFISVDQYICHCKMSNNSKSIESGPLEGEVWTITWGECTESHVGMKISGDMADHGFDLDDLKNFAKFFEERDCKTQLLSLNGLLPEEAKNLPGNDEAAVLVIRKGIGALCNYDKLSAELESTKSLVNKKALMRGVVKNKNARWGYCVGETSQEPNYEYGKGRTIAFNEHPRLAKLRKKIKKLTGLSLLAEVNEYYNPLKCYIGFHGDAERRLVVGCRLGGNFPLYYQWFHKSGPVGSRLNIDLNAGDMYIMSEKAVGTDWKRKKILTLRHAAGTEAIKIFNRSVAAKQKKNEANNE